MTPTLREKLPLSTLSVFQVQMLTEAKPVPTL